MSNNTLFELLGNLSNLDRDDFPWIRRSEQVVSAKTPYVILNGDINISNEEYEFLEAELIQRGYKEFLSKEDLLSIIQNLEQQKASYSSEHLFAAINYYWKNDAFIQI